MAQQRHSSGEDACWTVQGVLNTNQNNDTATPGLSQAVLLLCALHRITRQRQRQRHTVKMSLQLHQT
jgi:hypothetical protein